MADVIVRARAHLADAQRQSRVRAFQRLALAFFITAQPQCLRGRVQIEADDVPGLDRKLRSVDTLKVRT